MPRFYGDFYNNNNYDIVFHNGKKQTKDGHEDLVAMARLFTNNPVCTMYSPMLEALDTSEIRKRCYRCYDAFDDPVALSTHEVDKERPAPVMWPCQGCEIVSFCSEECRKLADRGFHRHECHLFRSLHPKIPPSSLRAVIRLLLIRQRPHVFADRHWKSLVKCDGHVDQIRKQGGKRWEDLVNLTQCAMEFTKTKENFETIVNIFCLLQTHGIPLQTQHFHSIGVAFHPLLTSLSHSCEPNSTIIFSIKTNYTNQGVRIVPIRNIAQDEKITIAYVDGSAPLKLRIPELQTTYLVDCKCARCHLDREEAIGPMPDDVFAKLQKIPELVRNADEATSRLVPIEHLRYAIHLLVSIDWCWYQYPYPMVARKLAYAYAEDHQWSLAFVYAAMMTLCDDDDPSPLTPESRADNMLLIRLMDKIINADDWSSQRLDLTDRGLNLVGLRSKMAKEILKMNDQNTSWTFPQDDRSRLQVIRNIDTAEGDKLVNDEDKLAESWNAVDDLVTEVLEQVKRSY